MYTILKRFALIPSDRSVIDGRFWIWLEPGEEGRLATLLDRCGDSKGFRSEEHGVFNSLERQVDIILSERPDVLRRANEPATT